MSYYGYRYYSAELGRWINRDPLNEAGSLLLRQLAKEKVYDDKQKRKGNGICRLKAKKNAIEGLINLIEEMNLYTYVGGNPITLVDPFGLKPTCEQLNINYKNCVKKCGDVLEQCLDFTDDSYAKCIKFYSSLCNKLSNFDSRKNCLRLVRVSCNAGISPMQGACVVTYGACRTACALNIPGDCGCPR